MADDVVVSCINCVFYLSPIHQPSVLGKNIGAPVCGATGRVLSSPKQSAFVTNKVYKSIASQCSVYKKGEHAPTASYATWEDDASLAISFPRPVEQVKDDQCRSCAMCQHFVRDSAVNSELGFSVGLCSAKGRLIRPNEKVQQANRCDRSKFGAAMDMIPSDLQLLPELADNFGSYDPVSAFKKSSESAVDPTEYSTDREISEEDRERGIRAWRAITDQGMTENTVWLPIYDLEKMDPEVRRKVPRTGDEEHPEHYIDHNNAVYKIAVLWTELDETPALWGMAGVGKTELFRHLAWMMCLPFERISITASTELDDLAGKMHFSKEKGTYFEYGRLPRAWNSPCVVCIDEPNVGAPEVWQFIRPLTDNSKQLVLDMNKGERISRHIDCYLGMAMNPAWDAKNVGAAPISDADGSRLMHIFMSLPPAALEMEIIKKRCELDGWKISEKMLKMVMDIANEVRPLTDDQTLPITWGVRPQIKAARALRWFDPVTAYRMASADFLEPEAQEALLDIVRSHETEDMF